MPRIQCSAVGCIYRENGYCQSKTVFIHKKNVYSDKEGSQVLWVCDAHYMGEEREELMRLLGGNVYGSNQKEEMA